MSTDIKFNALISLPKGFDTKTLKVNEEITIEKSGMRITPFYNPVELSTEEHVYIGKVLVTELKIVKDKTFITFTILKLFTKEESEVYSNNFIKASQ